MNKTHFILAATLSLGILCQAAQAQDRPPMKEPGTATLYSVLITGGGHFYAGETNKGLALLGISAGSVIAGAALSDWEDQLTCSGFNCEIEEANLTPYYIGVVAALGTWVYGITDAGSAARRANERNGYTGLQMRPTLIAANGSRKPGVSLTLSFNRQMDN